MWYIKTFRNLVSSCRIKTGKCFFGLISLISIRLMFLFLFIYFACHLFVKFLGQLGTLHVILDNISFVLLPKCTFAVLHFYTCWENIIFLGEKRPLCFFKLSPSSILLEGNDLLWWPLKGATKRQRRPLSSIFEWKCRYFVNILNEIIQIILIFFFQSIEI